MRLEHWSSYVLLFNQLILYIRSGKKYLTFNIRNTTKSSGYNGKAFRNQLKMFVFFFFNSLMTFHTSSTEKCLRSTQLSKFAKEVRWPFKTLLYAIYWSDDVLYSFYLLFVVLSNIWTSYLLGQLKKKICGWQITRLKLTSSIGRSIKKEFTSSCHFNCI